MTMSARETAELLLLAGRLVLFPPCRNLNHFAGQRSRDELQVDPFGHHDVQARRYLFNCCRICQHIS
jgi:hypothetical protein